MNIPANSTHHHHQHHPDHHQGAGSGDSTGDTKACSKSLSAQPAFSDNKPTHSITSKQQDANLDLSAKPVRMKLKIRNGAGDADETRDIDLVKNKIISLGSAFEPAIWEDIFVSPLTPRFTIIKRVLYHHSQRKISFFRVFQF